MCIEIPYSCPACNLENVIYWHNKDLEKGQWTYREVLDDTWGMVGPSNAQDPAHQIQTTSRIECKKCGSKVSYLVRWTLDVRNAFPFRGYSRMKDEYQIVCGNKDCRSVLAKLRPTNDGEIKKWE